MISITKVNWILMESHSEYDIFLAEMAVAAMPYHNKMNKKVPVYWEECSLHSWLLDCFVKELTDTGKCSNIAEISIPTIEQICRWFPEREKRICKASDYAKHLDIALFPPHDDICCYWLQDSGRREGYSATVVLSNGTIYNSAYMSAGNVGVRPCIKVRKG